MESFSATHAIVPYSITKGLQRTYLDLSFARLLVSLTWYMQKSRNTYDGVDKKIPMNFSVTL